MVESSRGEGGEPATFEVGAGDVVGNNLYQAFDEAVRGLAVGDRVRIKVRAAACAGSLAERLWTEASCTGSLGGAMAQAGMAGASFCGG